MNEHPRRLDVLRATGAFHTEHCDVPGEMTLGEWRRQCDTERRAAEPAPPVKRGGSVRRRLRRLVRG